LAGSDLIVAFTANESGKCDAKGASWLTAVATGVGSMSVEDMASTCMEWAKIE